MNFKKRACAAMLIGCLAVYEWIYYEWNQVIGQYYAYRRKV